MSALRPRAITLTIIISAAMVLAGSFGALATHQFSDVPADHDFHGEISDLANAGITTGYPDGAFRPGATVTRQAVAAFVSRAGGRIDLGYFEEAGVIGNDVDGNGTAEPLVLLGEVTIEPGATESGNGYVLLNGSNTATTYDVAACPCELDTLLYDVDAEEFLVSSIFNLSGTATEMDRVSASDGVQWALPVAADTPRTFALFLGTQDADVEAIGAFGELTATYIPFGPAEASSSTSDTSGRPTGREMGYEPGDLPDLN